MIPPTLKQTILLKLQMLSLPVFIGVGGVLAGASSLVSWQKADVTPVVLVRPERGGFVPVDANVGAHSWERADVQPVLLVKPAIGDFVPWEGSSIGNRWRRDDVLAVMLVEPSSGVFVPHKRTRGAAAWEPAAAEGDLIESRVDGGFHGWEGDTVVRLVNGQIWQQAEPYLRHQYAYMPSVLIYRSGSGHKMLVEGSAKSVRVKRLK